MWRTIPLRNGIFCLSEGHSLCPYAFPPLPKTGFIWVWRTVLLRHGMFILAKHKSLCTRLPSFYLWRVIISECEEPYCYEMGVRLSEGQSLCPCLPSFVFMIGYFIWVWSTILFTKREICSYYLASRHKLRIRKKHTIGLLLFQNMCRSVLRSDRTSAITYQRICIYLHFVYPYLLAIIGSDWWITILSVSYNLYSKYSYRSAQINRTAVKLTSEV